MPAFPIHERLVPYRILAYLLYARPIEVSWLEVVSDNQVRIITGDAARDLRMKNSNLWDALYWLETNKLVKSIAKEKKRGSAIITLKQPTNIKVEKKDK